MDLSICSKLFAPFGTYLPSGLAHRSIHSCFVGLTYYKHSVQNDFYERPRVLVYAMYNTLNFSGYVLFTFKFAATDIFHNIHNKTVRSGFNSEYFFFCRISLFCVSLSNKTKKNQWVNINTSCNNIHITSYKVW